MSESNHNHVTVRPSWLRILALACCLTVVCATVSAQSEAGDIIVTRVTGDVRVTMRSEPRVVQAGTIIELPATIRTGRDGSIDLQQGATAVSVAPGTDLEIPATPERGDALERLVQPRGNAFYNVGKRASRKLRVETPYLVAVIKGTQFNVAVQDASTTISLFEGRLEVRAPDDSDIVDLHAGEIAIRHATDTAIRVLRMDTGKPPASAPEGVRSEGVLGLAPSGPDDRGLPVPGAPSPIDDDLDRLISGSDPGITLDPSGASGADVSVGADVGLDSGSVNAAVDAGADLGVASADVGVDAGVDLGSGSVDLGAGASADLGVAAVDAGVDASADLGSATVDVGVDASADLGVASADLGVDAGAGLGSGSVDLGADAGVALGGAAVDASLDAGVDLGAGTVDAGVDTTIAGTDLGVSADVDLGSGDVGLDVGLGGLDVGLDIGLGGGDPAPAEDTSAPAPNDGGGLLDGLLGGK